MAGGEAALAADWIAAWKPSGEAALAADLITAFRPGRTLLLTVPAPPKDDFSIFFEVLRGRDQSQSLLQALKLNFLSKMCDLDAYLSSYVTFRHFCQVWEVAKPFFLNFDCPGTTKRRMKEAEIKSAASAASLVFAGERQDGGLACGRRGTGRSPANPREPVLAAALTTASLIRLW